MASSKFSTRKGLAVGLAVLGVAGLSLASASQLSSQWQSTTQAGTVDVDAACQKAATGTVKVKYDAPTLGASGYAPTQVQLTNIDGDCKGKTIRVAWKTGAGAYTALGAAQTLSATLTTADTVSFALPAATDYNTIAAFAVSIDG